MKKILFFLVALVVVLLIILNYNSSTYENQYLSDIVLVSAHWNEDLEWLKKAPCPVVVCDKEGAKPHTMKSDERYSCPSIKNLGDEASAYINFIVNNYDNLPEYVAFIHGHETSKNNRVDHQKNDIIEEIKKTKYRDKRFYPLNGSGMQDWGNGYAYWKNFTTDDWDKIFRPILKRDPPTFLKSEYAAQFIVSKNTIQTRSKEDYEFWLNYLLNSDNSQDGTYFEMMWHVIFGYPDIIEKYEDY